MSVLNQGLPGMLHQQPPNRKKDVNLEFSPLSDCIEKQLKDQDLNFDKKAVQVFQRECNAINELLFGNHLLTDSAADKLKEKLFKAVLKHLKSLPANKPKEALQ